MNMQSQIAAAKITGPNFTEPRVDPTKRQEEIVEILRIANQSRKGLSRFSEFSLAPARLDDAYTYFAQIRAVPRSGFGNAEFRFDIPARHSGEHEPKVVAANVLAAARLYNRHTRVGPYAKCVRELVEAAIEPATKWLKPMRLVAFGMSASAHGDLPKLSVDLEMLGEDLTVGIDRVVEHDIDRLEEKVAEQVAKHMAREKLWTIATASRACGWIDDIALRIVEASGMTCGEVVSRLRDTEFLDFCFGGEEGYDVSACLNWEDGVIRGHFRSLKNDCDFGADQLTVLRDKVSETDVASLPGRRFADLYEQPFIPADALITSVFTNGDWLYVRVAVGMSLIDEAAGCCRVARCAA
ncbi:hypothetical protein [Sphingomonas sp. UYP23]